MVELNDILFGSAALVFAFFVGILFWTVILRIVDKAFRKSRLYFIPEIFRGITSSIAFVVFLVSIYISIFFIDPTILALPLFKIWGIVLIFVLANIFAKTILGLIDINYRKSKVKEVVPLYRSLPMLKSAISIVLYTMAFVLSVQVLNTELGFVIALLSLLIGLFFFTVYHSQIKSIAAGFQLTNYYIEEGDLIEIDNKKGFVERIYARSTLLRTIDGKKLAIPNYLFFKKPMLLHKKDGNELTIYIGLKSRDLEKTRLRLSVISSKLAINIKDIPSESKPRIILNGVKDGVYKFAIYIRLATGADAEKVIDLLNGSLIKEFKEDVRSIRI